MATLVQRFIDTERLSEVNAVRPGEPCILGAVQYSTAQSYLTILNRYILPRWGEILLTQV